MVQHRESEPESCEEGIHGEGGRYKVLEPELTEEVIHVEGGG